MLKYCWEGTSCSEMGSIWLSGSAAGGSEREGGEQKEVMQHGDYGWEFLHCQVSLVADSESDNMPTDSPLTR